MKVFVWFEPERVTDVPNLSKNYGYKPEWGIDCGSCITSNLGDPECLAWTLGRITKMMGENEVDMYREDNNSNPARSWMLLDERDEQSLGLPRAGINENKCIQGHYALWDGIIDFCRRNGKCTFLDSCAGGGGRNDIESLRRSIPVMRSDFDRTTSSMRLFQSSGFNKWVPFHGSATKETAGQLENAPLAPDLYVTRASLLPIWKISGDFSHNPDLDFDVFRRNKNIWKQNNHLLVKDFYQLSEWHDSETDLTKWTVLAYNDPELEEGIITAFRQEECQEPSCVVKVPFVSAGKNYLITDDDSEETRILSGKELLEGIELTLPEPRSSLLWHITPVNE